MRIRPLSLALVCFSACVPQPPNEPPESPAPAAPAPVSVESTAGSTPTAGSPVHDAVAAADRAADDRALDAGRKPEEVFSFFGIAPGMRVADLGAGGGYTSELLARIVGRDGTVYGQNSKFILERFAEKPWTERLAKPVNAKIVRVDREFDDPLPPDAKDLDAVILRPLLSRHGLAQDESREHESRGVRCSQVGGHLRHRRPRRARRFRSATMPRRSTASKRRSWWRRWSAQDFVLRRRAMFSEIPMIPGIGTPRPRLPPIGVGPAIASRSASKSRDPGQMLEGLWHDTARRHRHLDPTRNG